MRGAARVFTPEQVESEIVRVSDQMDEEMDTLGERGERVARAEVDYKVARAQETLKASNMPGNGRDGTTTVDEREAIATQNTRDQYLEHLIAKAYWSVSREKLSTLRSQMDGLRTVAANMRAQT